MACRSKESGAYSFRQTGHFSYPGMLFSEVGIHPMNRLITIYLHGYWDISRNKGNDNLFLQYVPRMCIENQKSG